MYWKDSKICIKEAKSEDADELYPNLRKADLREIRALQKKEEDIPAAIRMGIVLSAKCYSVRYLESDELILIYGVVPNRFAKMNVGVVWMMGTDEIGNISMNFLRNCKKFIKELEDDYEVIHNMVHIENELHIRWLNWAGFTFIDKEIKIENNKNEANYFYEFFKVNDEKVEQ